MSADDLTDAWRVLGLEPGEIDAKVIRRAYAAKLREHRPDDDPAGFRAVRDAYEFLSQTPAELLAFLASSASDESDDDDADAPAIAVFPAPDDGPDDASALREESDDSEDEDRGALDPGWQQLIADAYATPPEQRAQAVRVAVLNVVAQAKGTAEGRRRLHRTLAGGFPSKVWGNLATVMPAELLVACLAAGESELPVWAMTALARSGKEATLARHVDVIIEKGTGLDQFESLQALIETARIVAVPLPDSAQRLLDLAWENATGDIRRMLSFDEIEHLVNVGKEVAFWRSSERALLTRVVLDGRLRENERSDVVEATRVAVRRTRDDAEVRAMLGSFAPSLVGGGAGLRPLAHDGGPERKKGLLGGKAILFVVFAFFIVVRVASRWERREQTPRIDLPTHSRDYREFLRDRSWRPSEDDGAEGGESSFERRYRRLQEKEQRGERLTPTEESMKRLLEGIVRRAERRRDR